ncbi:hypothetical protein NC652_029720 [Populus alba x Populus x berolinensis]|nr:hypothetical protein NC652_029720 [Populus alba x Populus x berolinensis]
MASGSLLLQWPLYSSSLTKMLVEWSSLSLLKEKSIAAEKLSNASPVGIRECPIHTHHDSKSAFAALPPSFSALLSDSCMEAKQGAAINMASKMCARINTWQTTSSKPMMLKLRLLKVPKERTQKPEYIIPNSPRTRTRFSTSSDHRTNELKLTPTLSPASWEQISDFLASSVLFS